MSSPKQPSVDVPERGRVVVHRDLERANVREEVRHLAVPAGQSRHDRCLAAPPVARAQGFHEPAHHRYDHVPLGRRGRERAQHVRRQPRHVAGHHHHVRRDRRAQRGHHAGEGPLPRQLRRIAHHRHAQPGERRSVGGVDTMSTTAHVTCVTDRSLSELVQNFGRDHAQAVWDAGLAAIAQIDSIVRGERIDCGWAFVDGVKHAAHGQISARQLKPPTRPGRMSLRRQRGTRAGACSLRPTRHRDSGTPTRTTSSHASASRSR